MTRLVSFIAAMTLVAPAVFAARENPAASPPQDFGGVVDAKGVRHKAADYPSHRIPGAEPVKMVGPEYPSRDRRHHHQGTGLFQLTLDLKSGAVTNITMIKSTGFVTLDRSARSALHEWRWAPGKWKEVTVPVTFTMSSANFVMPPGAKLLPPQYHSR